MEEGIGLVALCEEEWVAGHQADERSALCEEEDVAGYLADERSVLLME